MNSPEQIYPTGPEPEYDDHGNPTPEWQAAYDAWLDEGLDVDDVDEGQDGDDAQVITFPRQPGTAAKAGPAVVTPTVPTTGLWHHVGAELGELARVGRAKWADEAERRRELRAEMRPQVRDAEKALRNARKADPERIKASTHAAERHLRRVRREMPQPLGLVAVEAFVVVVVAAVIGGPRVPLAAWLWAALFGTTALAVGTALLMWRAKRRPQGLVPTAEERALLRRLEAAWWVRHAADRGLGGTVPGVARLTDAGIEVSVRLDGKWTPSGLLKAEDNVRALLRARTELRIQVRAGEHGGWAVMTLRTRSAADGVSLRWTPESEGIGIDTTTGAPVAWEPSGHKLFAGATGMGKSTSYRPLIAKILRERPNAAVILLDFKRQEASVWRGRIRVETEPRSAYEAVKSVVVELERRQRDSTGTTWVATEEDPELFVVVDEGAVPVRLAKRKEFKDFLDLFEIISTMGRAGLVWLWWATQYPTKGDGIPPQVAEMMLERLALTVEGPQADRVIFGEKAGDTGWQPSELSGIPGEALFKARGRKPDPLQLWYLDDDGVRALPPGLIWYGGDAGDVVGLHDEDQDPGGDTAGAVSTGPAATDERVLQLVAEHSGEVRQADIAERSGLPKSSLSRSVTRLIKAGRLTRDKDTGVLAVAATETTKNA